MTKYFLNPFAVSGDKETVPDTPGASTLVNYEEGYTPEYELDPDTDPNGNYVGRQRMNQLFNDITTNLKYWQDNSFPEFVADDGTGSPVSYPINAIVRYTDNKYYQAVIDGTTATDPSASAEFKEWPSLSNFAGNLIKGNQNWNVPGTDVTLTTTPQNVTSGQEFTLGWSANGGTIADAVRSPTGIFTANSATSTGTARYAYPKDLNGLITASTVKFYVNDGQGNQTLATGANGLTVTDDTNNVYLDIDFTVYTAGVGFVGISLFEGKIQPINDIQSSSEIVSKIVDYDYSNPSTGWYREYADGRVVQGGNLPVTSSAIVTFTIPIDSSTVFDANTGINSASVGVANTGIASFTNTQATVYCENAGARQVFWSVEAYKL